MIFDFLKKQKDSKKKIELIRIMIQSVNLPENNKFLYLEALEVLDENWLNNLYDDLIKFTENFEMKELEDINKNNFSSISWLRKKEAEEKQQEINAFTFLINNV